MAAQSLSTFDQSLKDYYEGAVRKVLNRQVRLWHYMKKGAKQWDGRQVVFPVNVQGTGAITLQPAGGALPAPIAQSTQDIKIPAREIWGRIQILHDVIEAARSDRGAFEKPVSLEVRRMAEDLTDRANILAFGEGTGKIGEVKTVSGTTITCLSSGDTVSGTYPYNGNTGVRYLKNGDLIDLYSNAGTPAAHLQGGAVSAISISADTFTLTGGVQSGGGPVATDGIYWARTDLGSPHQAITAAASSGGAPGGLGALVDDGTYVDNYFNVTRSTYPIYKAQAINVGASFAARGALLLDQFQRAADLANEGGAGFPGVAVFHHSVRREFLKLVVTDRRYSDTFKYEPGIDEDEQKEWPWKTTATFDGFPVVAEKHCPWFTGFFLDPRACRKWVNRDFHWVGRGGADSLYLVPGYGGVFEAQCAMFYNIATDDVAPATCAVLRNISVSNLDRAFIV